MKQRGFTLIELAMVLFIVSLVIGGFLLPFANQLKLKKYSNAEDDLILMRDALILFAVKNKRIPCADINNDGLEDCPEIGGLFPWKTIGMNNANDPWGRQYLYFVDSHFINGFSMYHPVMDGGIPPALILDINGNPQYFINYYTVIDSNGNLMTPPYPSTQPSSEYPVVIIYSVGHNGQPDGENANNNTAFQGGIYTDQFDDALIWLSRPLLFSRMLKYGALP